MIKENIRNISLSIHQLKQKAISSQYNYMCPLHPQWQEYIGKKYEATKWLVALHLVRGNQHKITSHTNSKKLIKQAWASIANIAEKCRKEEAHA